MNSRIAVITGWLLFFSLVISICSSLTSQLDSYWAGILIWLAALLFIPSLKKGQQRQATILISIGALGLLLGWIMDATGFNVSQSWSSAFIKAVEANQIVITMLIAVGFLKSLLSAKELTQNTLPKGRGALLLTLVNAHLFSSVLNMSSVIIVGDRIAQRQSITPVQGMLLLRAFGICAFWSPFFAAMGLTLLSSPGSQFTTLMIYGIPISLIGIGISAWEIVRQPSSPELHGYPIAFESLWIPCFLALVVIIGHHWLPSKSVLTLVSMTALFFTLFWLLFNQGINGIKRFISHIESGVAESKGEVVLFAAAALLASGVVSVLTSLNLDLAPNHFGYIEASITLFVLVMLAMTGMHPVTSVILAGSILAPSVTDPNLLGITLLMSWSLGISLSPFSGIQLSIQSRYNISALDLLKLNYRYAVLMYIGCLAVLWLYVSTHI